MCLYVCMCLNRRMQIDTYCNVQIHTGRALVCMCMYTFICICKYICLHGHTHMYVLPSMHNTSTYALWTNSGMGAYMHIHKYRHACMHAYIHTCIRTYIHKQVCAQTMYIFTYIHTCIYAGLRHGWSPSAPPYGRLRVCWQRPKTAK